MRAAASPTAASGEPPLTIPPEVAAQPFNQTMARVIGLTPDAPADTDDAEWRPARARQEPQLPPAARTPKPEAILNRNNL